MHTLGFLRVSDLWSAAQVACETFCLDDDDSFLEATMAFKSESISPSSIRFVDAEPQEIDQGQWRAVVLF